MRRKVDMHTCSGSPSINSVYYSFCTVDTGLPFRSWEGVGLVILKEMLNELFPFLTPEIN